MATFVRTAFAASLLALSTLPAEAHDWYPHECCHGQDCAVVESIRVIDPSMTTTADGQIMATMRVTTRHGTAIVPSNFPRRESKDNRMHACMRFSLEMKDMKLICLFMPPSM